MHELWLLRHAEAAARVDDDRERPLTAHGQRQARAVGAWLAAHGPAPGRVLCSPARRTRETAAAVRSALPTPPPITLDAAIYEASAGELIQALEALEALATATSVLLVAHNPGISNLARQLCPASEASRGGMRPATLLRIALRGPLQPGCGRLLAHFAP